MYVLIVNEDPLGRSLATALVARGHEVAYLDEDAEYCNMVASDLGCLVIQGETTNVRVLQEAGIRQADVLVALTKKDIKNILIGLFGRQFHVPHTLALIRQEHYRAAYELAGISEIFSAFDYLQNKLLIAIEDPDVRHVMAIGDGRVEIAGIGVPDGSPFVGRPLGDVAAHRRFPEHAQLLGVLELAGQRFRAPRDVPALAVGDEVLALAEPGEIHGIADLVHGRRRRAR